MKFNPGEMRNIIQIAERIIEKDEDGFARNPHQYNILKTVRAYKEDRRGTKVWANRAAFSNANVLFRLRKIKDFEITPQLFIKHQGKIYSISSVENIGNMGMYIEVLCDSTEGSEK